MDGGSGIPMTAWLEEDEREKSVVIVDPSRPDMPIIYVSEDFTRHTGYTAAEAVGRNCRFLQGCETDPVTARAIRDALAARRRITVDILNYRKDGTRFWNRLRIRPLVDDRGRLQYFVGVQNPIPAARVRPMVAADLFN